MGPAFLRTHRPLNTMKLFPYVAAFLLSFQPQRTRAALRSYNLTLHTGTRAPDGVSREVYLINGQQPGPLIEAEEGDELEIFVQNDLPVEQTIHWHGILQDGTPDMDGVPGVTQFPIPATGNFTYRFSVASEYGFYWYHSHFRAYYNDAIRGPLIIHPSSSRRRPFESLAEDKAELSKMLQAERGAIPVVLADWYHRPSDIVYGEYFTTGAFPQCVDSLLANGQGRVRCLLQNVLQAGPGLGIQSDVANDPHDSVPMDSTMSMPSMSDTSNSDMPMPTSTTTALISMDSSMSMRKRSEHSSMSMSDSMPTDTSTASPTGTSNPDMTTMSGMSDISTLGPKAAACR